MLYQFQAPSKTTSEKIQDGVYEYEERFYGYGNNPYDYESGDALYGTQGVVTSYFFIRNGVLQYKLRDRFDTKSPGIPAFYEKIDLYTEDSIEYAYSQYPKGHSFEIFKTKEGVFIYDQDDERSFPLFKTKRNKSFSGVSVFFNSKDYESSSTWRYLGKERIIIMNKKVKAHVVTHPSNYFKKDETLKVYYHHKTFLPLRYTFDHGNGKRYELSLTKINPIDNFIEVPYWELEGIDPTYELNRIKEILRLNKMGIPVKVQER